MGEFFVQYDKKFGSSNYGSEGLAMSWRWTDDELEQEGAGEALSATADLLRTLVLHELARSADEKVRWAANHELKAHNPKQTPDEQAWKQAEASAEYELAAGLRDNARQEDESREDLPF